MKATHNKASKPDKVEWKFPCLGIGLAGTIVLFRAEQKGMAVGDSKLSYYTENWDMDKFVPLPSTESVTLQND
jgi:hypothetical protein